MKFISTEIAYLLSQPASRRNLKVLSQYLVLLLATVATFSVLFHLIMLYEGRDYSWLTGVYWTLTVMSTLGFGDITFDSDLGRAFSVVVLIIGIVMLLIVLPFAFIRFFYAPWLEAQIRLRAPRELGPDVRGHVVIARYDDIVRGFIRRLELRRIPYCVIEPEMTRAAELHTDGVHVITGDVDSHVTYGHANVTAARLVVANLDDASNTNITLTVREVAPNVPVLAFVESVESLDILELSGANHVICLKQRLGQQLANRVSSGHREAHVVGSYADLEIAEFAVHGSELVGRTIRDTRLRERTGLNIVGCWERGHLLPARPDAVLGDSSVVVVAGTAEQLTQLNAMFRNAPANDNPVVVLGGGNVGRAVIESLLARGIAVHAVERDPSAREELEALGAKVFVGDAADRKVLMAAGLDRAPSVVLTTNDDAINIYLAIYCRRLNPELRIVSRITHERNLEAIHRAGAEFVLSYATLGLKSLLAVLHQRPLVILGEGADLFGLSVPRSLRGSTLAQSGIGARTGMTVIAIQEGEHVVTNPAPNTVLEDGQELITIGSSEQREAFEREFERTRPGGRASQG